jgi:uncharacterized Rmd1/YagE family protein
MEVFSRYEESQNTWANVITPLAKQMKSSGEVKKKVQEGVRKVKQVFIQRVEATQTISSRVGPDIIEHYTK